MLDPSNGFSETDKAVIELKEDDPAAMAAMLRYIYTFAYEDPNDTSVSSPQFHLDVYLTARKYLIEKLQGKAWKALEDRIAALTAGCVEGGDGGSLFEYVQFIAWQRESIAATDAWARKLVRKHIKLLMGVKDFRLSLASEESYTLVSLNEAIEREHSHKLKICSYCSKQWTDEDPGPTCSAYRNSAHNLSTYKIICKSNQG